VNNEYEYIEHSAYYSSRQLLQHNSWNGVKRTASSTQDCKVYTKACFIAKWCLRQTSFAYTNSSSPITLYNALSRLATNRCLH